MSFFSLFPFVVLAVLVFVGRKLMPGLGGLTPPVPAGELAQRLSLTLVEGDPSSDLVFRPSLTGIPDRSIRMVGTVAGRSVELVQRHRTSPPRIGLLGSEWTEEHDCRLTLGVRSAAQLEIVQHAGTHLHVRRVVQPIVTLGDPTLDALLEIRAADRRVAELLLAELARLAEIPLAHVTMVDGSLTLHEATGSSMLALHAERALPVLQQIANRLEGHDVEHIEAIDDGPTRTMSAPASCDANEPAVTELGAVVDVLRPPPAQQGAGVLATLVLGIATTGTLISAVVQSSLPLVGLSCGLALLTFGGLAVTASADRSKLVLRQHGFEWHRLRGTLSFRYGDIVDPRYEILHVHGTRPMDTLWFDHDRSSYLLQDFNGLAQLAQAMQRAR